MENPKPYVNVSSATAIAADQSPPMLPSLPNDVVLNCLARVPKRYDSVLSCVSKSFRSLVLSPELPQTRSLMMGKKDDPFLYVCFTTETTIRRDQFHWFTFNPNDKKTSGQSSIPILSQPSLYCSTVSIGSKIYFIGGSMYNTSRALWIFDSLSGELSKGPRMRKARMLPGVGVVDGKIYVMGGCREDQIHVEVFEAKTQTWQVGPVSSDGEVRHGEGYVRHGVIVTQAVAVEGKIYGMSYLKGSNIIYGTKDGRCDTFKMANEDTWRRGGACVIDNVIYVYYSDLGLMWYDFKVKVWRFVIGLKLNNSIEVPVGMVDCNGKLAFLWEDCSNRTKKKIWCTMIVLEYRSREAIHGMVEWSDLLGSVPRDYSIWRCLGVSC